MKTAPVKLAVCWAFVLVVFVSPYSAAADTPPSFAYGSGNHGAWLVDRYGLPV